MAWLYAALKGIWLRRYGELRRAIRVSPAFAFVAWRLCNASTGVLDREDVDVALRKEGLDVSVEDLVKENLLGVRPQSEWASDVPPADFPDKCDEVVTTCSAVDLYCLKGLRDDGLLSEVRLEYCIARSPSPFLLITGARRCLVVEAGACGMRGVEFQQQP